MQFVVVPLHVGSYQHGSNICYLTANDWDDFSFKTSFRIVLFDAFGNRHDLGHLRILRAGSQGGRTELPYQTFQALDDRYCSLGNDQAYYSKLSIVEDSSKKDFLESIKDCVFDLRIFRKFEDESGMINSLLRFVNERDVVENFRNALGGEKEHLGYSSTFTFAADAAGNTQTCNLSLVPRSMPPTNLHALIGRNGVGKTRVLGGMADALTQNRAASRGIKGEFTFADGEVFRSLIILSFSVFDPFNPFSEGAARSADGAIPFYYIGIKKPVPNDPKSDYSLKTFSDLQEELDRSLFQIGQNDLRFDYWKQSLRYLRSDPGLAEVFDDIDIERDNIDQAFLNLVANKFRLMSSGHKIVLLSITKIAELLSDYSLVLIDEPETHLHPPLLGSFLRGLSHLLDKKHSLALIATHSPVVLQEIPETCVSIITRSGTTLSVSSPSCETFAESVSVLTRKVFALEVENSGYYKLLSDASHEEDYDDVLRAFDDLVGSEGRALVRHFTSKHLTERGK